MSPHRFNVVPAGRRSGKTERAKRKLVYRALSSNTPWNPRFFAAAPTRDQAKRIFWDDLKALVPKNCFAGPPSESQLILPLVNGAEIHVLGMDKPERVEGTPWDGGVLDEYGNMKPRAWTMHVRPALSDRNGWCDLIGVPEGRNHYYDLAVDAQAQMQALGDKSEWGYYHWKSADILPASEVEAFRRDVDDLTFQQEFEGSFVNFVGRAYYQFDRDTHCAPLKYDPSKRLIICFDFNVDPGVACICQEQIMPGKYDEDGKPLSGTGVIGEVYIPRNSNTIAVCNKVMQDWGDHDGEVWMYGDATGGARKTSATDGSDWDLIRAEFGSSVTYEVSRTNPTQRARLNAMNTRIMTSSGEVHLMVDPVRAPHVVKDLEGVRLLEGGSGELDKKIDPMLTHISDALGYYVAERYPVNAAPVGQRGLYARS
jgi:hypothetical protein